MYSPETYRLWWGFGVLFCVLVWFGSSCVHMKISESRCFLSVADGMPAIHRAAGAVQSWNQVWLGLPRFQVVTSTAGAQLLEPSVSLSWQKGSFLRWVSSALEFWASVLKATQRTRASTRPDNIVSTQCLILSHAISLPRFYLSFYVNYLSSVAEF